MACWTWRWAEIRRIHFVERLSIRSIARRTAHDRKTVQRAIRSDAPSRSRTSACRLKAIPSRTSRPLLSAEPKLPGTGLRELIEPLGYTGSKTILDDYLREIRPRYLPAPRTFQRTVYRPGEVLQVDLLASGGRCR